MEKFKDYPTIFITVKGIGFIFLLDTSSKYNLCTPCFADFFHEDSLTSTETEPKGRAIESPFSVFGDVFQKQGGIKDIKCKNGIKAGCSSAKIQFEHDGKTYRDLFYIDPSLCAYCKPKNKIAAILGISFLKKHKFVIDFGRLGITKKD